MAPGTELSLRLGALQVSTCRLLDSHSLLDDEVAVHKFDLLFVTCSMMLAPSTYRRTSTFRLASEPYLADMRVAFPGWYTDMSHGLMNLGVRDDEWIHDE